jgi:hypothetical protein
MSKRFPEFSRLYRQTFRPKPNPRLHPAMRARMWQPGQSGNPSGVSKAYAEATREVSMGPIEMSPGAERTRRWREKREQGVIVVSVDVAPGLTDKLLHLGWLDPAARLDKRAISTALIDLVNRAIELEVMRHPSTGTTHPGARAHARGEILSAEEDSDG